MLSDPASSLRSQRLLQPDCSQTVFHPQFIVLSATTDMAVGMLFVQATNTQVDPILDRASGSAEQAMNLTAFQAIHIQTSQA